jgi:CheY-like chemotaxis protein
VGPSRAGHNDGVTVSVLVVDDQVSLVQLLRLLLEQDDRFGDIASAADGPEALAAAAEHHPDVVVLDALLGHSDGLALVRPLRASVPDASVVVFSSAPYADRASSLLAGADDFVEKGTDLDVLLDTLAAAGEPGLLRVSG